MELLKKCNDAEKLREIVGYFYDLLDDIDTVSDIAKDNNELYRNLVEKIQEKKNYYIESDGYELFLKQSTDERPKTMYEVMENDK